MDKFQFVSSIVGSIAWPTVLLALALIFRKALTKLTERLTDLEVGGGKAKFEKSLNEAEETANKLPEPEPDKDEGATKPDDVFLELAERVPEAAVMMAFKEVEFALKDHMREFGIKGPMSINAMLDTLAADGFLSKDLHDLYKGVYNTRNVAVHAAEGTITPGEAIAYRDLCLRLTKHLRKALKARIKEKNVAMKAAEAKK